MADRAQSEYRIFRNKMSSFDISSDRVDQLYFSLINNERKNLYEVIKLCMLLSHGNARVEAGFSINEQFLEVNMKESSVVNQRIVYEGILNEGGILKVKVDSTMLKYVKQSANEYQLALEKNRKRQTFGEKRKQESRQSTKEINATKKTKKETVETHGCENSFHRRSFQKISMILWQGLYVDYTK